MTDIEVKRKELETAKRLLQDGTCARQDCDCCPFGCSFHNPWDSLNSSATATINTFISTREAELAEMEKGDLEADLIASGHVKVGKIHGVVGKPFEVYEKRPNGFVPTTGATSDGLSHIQTVPERTLRDVMPDVFRHADRIPTLDDFALALIQGGFKVTMPGYDKGESFKALYSLAEELKAESDLRRGE